MHHNIWRDSTLATEVATGMEQSLEIRNAILRFYERFSAGDVAGLERMLTQGPGVLVIGTDPGEWYEGRAEWVAAFKEQMEAIPGIRLEAGDPRGFVEGSAGWLADRPSFVLPDGTTIPTRLTSVMEEEDGEWKLVQLHFSVGVPNDELIDLAKRLSR